MINQVFSIRDLKMDEFMQPFVVKNSLIAVRVLGDLVKQSGSSVGAHPEDFVLFQLASFNSETGKFENLVAPSEVMSASSFSVVSDAS